MWQRPPWQPSSSHHYASDPADTETESEVDMKAARDNFT